MQRIVYFMYTMLIQWTRICLNCVCTDYCCIVYLPHSALPVPVPSLTHLHLPLAQFRATNDTTTDSKCQDLVIVFDATDVFL